MRRLLAASLLLLTACPPPTVVNRPYAPPSANELIATVLKRQETIRSLRANTKVDHMGPNGERVKVEMNFLVARPNKLRVEAVSPMGSALATLVSDGATFSLLDVRANRFLQGPAKACNVARLIRLELPPEAIVEVMTGGAPISGTNPVVSWDPSFGGRDVLTLEQPDGGKEVVRFDRDRDVLEAVRTDAKGNIAWRVTHENFDYESGVRLPKKTFVEEPPLKTDARIKFREVEVNLPPSANIFTLSPPQGVPVEPANCD